MEIDSKQQKNDVKNPLGKGNYSLFDENEAAILTFEPLGLLKVDTDKNIRKLKLELSLRIV